MKRHYLIYTLWAGMAIFSLPSCVREEMLHGGEFSEEENVIPGLETTVSLKVNVPDMDVATRADMAQGTDSELNSLWVGIFSATSGECTYAGFVDAEANGEESVDLEPSMFYEWDGYDKDASKPQQTNCDYKIGPEYKLDGGATVYGNGSVLRHQFADLTGYEKIQFTGSSGTSLRLLFNRQDEGNGTDYQEIKPTIGNSGTVEVDLSEVEKNYAHLNVIKIDWGSAGTVTSIKLVKPATGQLSGEHGNETNFARLENIKTKTGPSYIVAVGNPEGNIGYQYIEGSPDPFKATPLNELLPKSAETANNPTSGPKFTWETYKNIAISRSSLTNVTDVPNGNLPMSGIYYKYRKDHPEPTAAGWETANETPVVIPVVEPGTKKELDGAIHLRRLISQVKFTIKAIDYNQPGNSKEGVRVVSVKPVSYEIVNAPYSSWLHERKSPGNDANSGDKIKISSVTYGNGALPLKANYRTSAKYEGDQYISVSDDDVYSFDFWMLENKRWALGEASLKYDDREKERKNESLNTGLYTALCGEAGEETMNNMATFVVIRCKIEYTEPDPDNPAQSSGIGSLVDTEYADVQHRLADAVYTIHLGGIDDNWNDFSHRRNHKYTYNVTVMDVDRIIVEAKGGEGDNPEPRPGIEGVVTDITEPVFDLDAHYGVFNIALSNKERTGGRANPYPEGFPFRLQVYNRYGTPIIIDQANCGEFYELENDPNDDTLHKPEYYWTWVELRPTTGPDILADYKPYHKKDEYGHYINEDTFVYDNRTFRLNEIANIKDYPGFDKNGSDVKDDPDDEEPRWYTVFVNEYTYETSANETQNRWVLYANRPERICWLNVTNAESSDKESIYIKSKYMLIQRSIQTFYDIDEKVNPADANLDAVGLEHVNETYGFTLRWANRAGDEWDGGDEGYALDNGKRNTRYYLRWDGKEDDTSDIDWSRYVNQNNLQKIEGLNESAFQFSKVYPVTGLPQERTYFVPSTKPYTYSRTQGSRYEPDNWWNQDKYDERFLPKTGANNAVQAIEACMNRNRDNNGNGKIDRNEIRWYLPSSSELVDFVNGLKSLVTPLMDYTSNPILYSPEMTDYSDKVHHVNTRFHYASSNHRLLWAEEGITINPTTDRESAWNRMGWQVRCARALGTDLGEETALSSAFSVDDPNAPTQIYPTYFEAKTLRNPTQDALPPHSETSPLNRISTTGFEFSKELITNITYHFEGDNSLITNHDYYIEQGNAACKQLNTTTGRTGWRMPNIKESSVIKVALNQAGLNYKDENHFVTDTEYNSDIDRYNGYDIGCFYSCTYREYGLDTGFPHVRRADVDPTGYYLGIVYDEPWDRITQDWWGTEQFVRYDNFNKENAMGRAQCLTQYDESTGLPKYYVRCVRDL